MCVCLDISGYIWIFLSSVRSPSILTWGLSGAGIIGIDNSSIHQHGGAIILFIVKAKSIAGE